MKVSFSKFIIFAFLIVNFFIISIQSQISKDNDNRFDPSPKPIPSLSKTKETPEKTPEKTFTPLPTITPDNPQQNSESELLKFEHIGYEVSEIFHKDNYNFANYVATEIKKLNDSENEIETIIVTGFADGIPNGGISTNKRKTAFELSKLSMNCKQNIGNTIDDPELAYLRGCGLWEQVSDLLEINFTRLVTRKIHDEPDGTKKGNLYRKVSIEIQFRSTK